jgi:hypothetical protein
MAFVDRKKYGESRRTATVFAGTPVTFERSIAVHDKSGREGGSHMLSRTVQSEFWAPQKETVSAIGATLCAHWVAAKAAAKDQFWGKPQSWLDVPRHYLNRVTISR